MKTSITGFTLVFCTSLLLAQQHPSIHQEQANQYRNQPPVPTEIATVFNGIDVLLDQQAGRLNGKNIALVTNHSGIDKQGCPNYERLLELEQVNLQIIFSPEHGLFGEAAAGEKVKYGKELKELPEVISLYGKIRKPTAEMLAGVDLLLYDIQDIGARFYTYISTMGLVMEAAAELGIPVWILDRPNPIRGDRFEGPLLDLSHQSFVGYYPIPIRYGLTAGELARMIVGEKWIAALPELEVIPIQGWTRDRWFDETDLPWIKPSPNIPDLETALIYPGLCLLEGTNVSEGRGTYQPFKRIGAPWIDSHQLAQFLNKQQLPGVVFKPVEFTPVSIPGMSGKPKFQDMLCNGIEIVVTDRINFNSVATGVHLLTAIHTLYPDDFEVRTKSVNRLWGSIYLDRYFSTAKTTSAEIHESISNITDYELLTKKYRLYSSNNPNE